MEPALSEESLATSSTTSDEDIDERFAEIIAAEWPKLTGRQTPFAQSFQVGSWELGEKVVELARRMMVRTMPWQTWSIEKIMAKNPDGTWTHPECCLIVPRQNGKSLILSLVVIYRMFKLGEQIIFSAQQWETAKSLWKRTWNMVRSHVDLLSLVESHTCSQGRGTIVNISSVLGLVALKWRGAYNASKFALEGLTDTLRLEMEDTPIRVVLVEPGPITSRFRENATRQFERWIDWQASPRAAQYEASLLKRLYAPPRKDRFELPAEAVARVVARAIEARRPKPRYYVTTPTYIAGIGRRLLPTRALDWVARRG